MKQLLVLLFSIITVSTYAQESSLRIFYGFADAELLESEDLDGGSNSEVENLFELGVEYTIPISSKLSIMPGLTYTKTDLQTSSTLYYDLLSSYYNERNYTQPAPLLEEIELLSIPVLVEFSFWNYFFVNGGPVVSFQLNDNSINSQEGIGYHLGFGGKYSFNNLFIYANPFFKQFAAIDFKDEHRDLNLSQFGVHLGLGYKF
ncbi:outer membrane beta-barrel protein [Zunongwangia sp. HGR-M22]|uniref:outer membrane beta-barrel protein n=1 Tax=Zunongwangia sp. HGR-M22 TaxID=3015168 RepID=UPI0022DDE058|nr:outer membrane beta-barrel protein [Zunongwangia sp. HGR-M22]WBL27283.1 outer membrane beta-barrel protein [Zunongwangia sp. HGR-M22]